jgi:membrane fusion protein (multidrug efflux system)
MNPTPNQNEAKAREPNPATPSTSPGPAATTAAPPAQEKASTPIGVPPAHPPTARGSRRKKVIFAGLGLVVLAAGCYFGIPMLLLALNTVSTDDAYVNGHVTFVAARVPGQVIEVKVDDNRRVKQGDLLVLLDPEPYQVQVNLKLAILATAKAEKEVTEAQVRGMVAQARSNRFKLEHAIENVNNQVAQLRATVDAVDSDLAKRDRALKDFERVKELMRTPGAATPQDLDLKLQDYLVAKAKVRQSLQGVLQIRASLGLATKPVNADEITKYVAAIGLALAAKPATADEITKAPEFLAETPVDLDQTFSTVRQAAADLMQSAAPLGVTPSSFDLPPRKILEEFLKRDPEGNIDRIYAKIIKEAPALEQAKAKVFQAERDLKQALLNLSYCTVRAEIDGVVTRRNVNPGNNVQAGQSLMAVRSLTEIWIDANFKETQLADLRIGQLVKIEVDMYGSRHEFKGRITGFTMGTGQTLSLLPPQNATGNFVKIVQRLPVKVELIEYNPDKDPPLFIGLSVTPYVYIHEPLIENDPGKGKALQPYQARGGKP